MICLSVIRSGIVLVIFCFFFFKQKTAYEMRISDWSSDVCSSDLPGGAAEAAARRRGDPDPGIQAGECGARGPSRPARGSKAARSTRAARPAVTGGEGFHRSGRVPCVLLPARSRSGFAEPVLGPRAARTRGAKAGRDAPSGLLSMRIFRCVSRIYLILRSVAGRQAGRASRRTQQRCYTRRSEEHTSELQSLMRISYAVFFLKKKKQTIKKPHHKEQH